MPRFPHVSPSIGATRASPYSSLAGRLARRTGPVYPLHVGDTWMEPAAGAHMQDLRTDEHPGMHRYTSPHGYPPLVEALAERVQARTGVPTERGNVLVTAGGTGGLGAVAGALVAPGDEVLIAAPFWPLIAGIVRSFHGVAVPVPLIGAATTADEAVAAFASRITDRTIAVYLNTPNNPTGAVLPPAWVEAIVAWAAARDLWIWSDEIYEDYVYRGTHVYARRLAPERTFSASARRTGWPATGSATSSGRATTSTTSSRWRPTRSTARRRPARSPRCGCSVLRATPGSRRPARRTTGSVGSPPPRSASPIPTGAPSSSWTWRATSTSAGSTACSRTNSPRCSTSSSRR